MISSGYVFGISLRRNFLIAIVEMNALIASVMDWNKEYLEFPANRFACLKYNCLRGKGYQAIRPR